MSDENEKPVYVVFKQDTTAKNNIAVNNFDVECGDIIKDITKQSLRKKLEVMRIEYEKANEKRNLISSRLMETVEKANVLDNRNTEKCLNSVESIIKLFSNDLNPFEKLLENIMNRLTAES